MLRSLPHRGARALFYTDGAAMSSRSIHRQCRLMAPPRSKLFSAQLNCRAPQRQIHQPRRRPSPSSPSPSPSPSSYAPPPNPPPNPLEEIRRKRYTLRREVVWTFIGTNLVVFFWWQQANVEAHKKVRELQEFPDPSNPDAQPRAEKLQHMLQYYTLSPRNIEEGRWLTLLTCAFSHQRLDHLLFNMISFNAFAGFALLGGMPLRAFLTLTVGSALASDAAMLFDWNRKGDSDRRGLGASGVISGMATACACVRPWAPFQLMFIPVGIPLWGLVIAYIAYDSYRLNSEESSIGHAAHLGGSAFGVAWYALAFRGKYGGVLNALKMVFRR